VSALIRLADPLGWPRFFANARGGMFYDPTKTKALPDHLACEASDSGFKVVRACTAPDSVDTELMVIVPTESHQPPLAVSLSGRWVGAAGNDASRSGA
jgi:hypothetical protein